MVTKYEDQHQLHLFEREEDIVEEDCFKSIDRCTIGGFDLRDSRGRHFDLPRVLPSSNDGHDGQHGTISSFDLRDSREHCFDLPHALPSSDDGHDGSHGTAYLLMADAAGMHSYEVALQLCYSHGVGGPCVAGRSGSDGGSSLGSGGGGGGGGGAGGGPHYFYFYYGHSYPSSYTYTFWR